jgi:hypothetical protein
MHACGEYGPGILQLRFASSLPTSSTVRHVFRLVINVA